jgi:hypothetical protein
MAESSSPASADVQHSQQEDTTWEVLGAWCAKEEMKWYAENPGPFSPIDNRGNRGNRHFSKHLDDAVEVAEKRFAPCTEEEDNDHAASTNTISRSPFLLVATNVKAGWLPPNKYRNLHYMFTPMEGNAALCALFITCMPGADHGLAHIALNNLIFLYCHRNGLDRVLMGCINGGKEYQPDLSYIPQHPDPNQTVNAPDKDDEGKPWKRMVIEIEFHNRTQSGLQEVGHTFLNGPNPYASLFVAIKVWQKHAPTGNATTGTFAAAAVIWERTPPGLGAGNVTVRQALDFGTHRMPQDSIDAWTRIPAPGAPPMLPPVPPTFWRRPIEFDNPLEEFQPGQPEPAIIQDCCLILPREAMFYRVSYGNAPQAMYVTGRLPTLQDCEIDMLIYQRDLNENLK